jgi:hypothetical protein
MWLSAFNLLSLWSVFLLYSYNQSIHNIKSPPFFKPFSIDKPTDLIVDIRGKRHGGNVKKWSDFYKGSALWRWLCVTKTLRHQNQMLHVVLFACGRLWIAKNGADCLPGQGATLLRWWLKIVRMYIWVQAHDLGFRVWLSIHYVDDMNTWLCRSNT